jgi:hypothetical protein
VAADMAVMTICIEPRASSSRRVLFFREGVSGFSRRPFFVCQPDIIEKSSHSVIPNR